MSSNGFRSTGFVILSILVHGACVAAVALSPTRTVSDAGDKIEVQIGEPAEKPGVAEAAPSKEESKPQVVAEPAPQPKAEVKPEPKPEVVAKPAPVKAAPVKTVKASPKPAPKTATATPKHSPAPAVEKGDESSIVEQAEEKTEDTKEILMPVKDTAPAGVEAATSDEEPAATEAKSEDVAKASDPSPVAPVSVASAKGEDSETGDLTKGGASKEGAVNYLELKQLPGNKSPKYPMQARLEKRQGNLELLYRVTTEGKVTDISVAKSSGFKDLDSEAMKAIAQFKFVPGQEGWARHAVTFNLKGAVTTMPSQLRGKGAQVD